MMNQNTAGFTLMELMIVVAIAGILATFAYPSYVDAVQRSGRSDAQAQINTVANSLEQYFAANRTYTTTLSDMGYTSDLSATGKYTTTIAAGQTGSIATSYLITVSPDSGSPQANDTECLAFTLNSAAQRTPDPHSSTCW